MDWGNIPSRDTGPQPQEQLCPKLVNCGPLPGYPEWCDVISWSPFQGWLRGQGRRCLRSSVLVSVLSGEFRVFVVAFKGSRIKGLEALAVMWITYTKTDSCSALWPALFSALLIPTCLIDTLVDGVINNAWIIAWPVDFKMGEMINMLEIQLGGTG